MHYIDSFKLQPKEKLSNYWYGLTYPWNIFIKKDFEWINCKDITIFYGNNGSGKSTILNLIAEKLGAKRTIEIFKDYIYDKSGEKINFFDDFIKQITIKMVKDDYDNEIDLPETIQLITSDDIFKKIDNLISYNNKILNDITKKRNGYVEIKRNSQEFKATLDNYDELVKIIQTKRLSKTAYSLVDAGHKEKIQSNGETALEFYRQAFKFGGIYLLDEPENCLSPIFQIELMKLIQDASRYQECQFFICTHSPFILSLKDAIIYNMDLEYVISQKWEELENVRIYYDFFKSKKNLFE